jgi:hypothetical protein
MPSLSLIELQRAGQRLQHAFRDPVHVPALEAGVVVDTDPGEDHDLFPAEFFDRIVRLEDVPDGYRAMNEREAIKVLIES